MQIATLRSTLRSRGASLRRKILLLLLPYPRRRQQQLLLKRLPPLRLRVERISVLFATMSRRSSVKLSASGRGDEAHVLRHRR